VLENIDNSSILNSTFLNNQRSRGAAIYHTCPDYLMKECQLIIDSSSFINNSASVKGGALNYNHYKPFLFNLSFSNNSAPYGPNVASYPARIKPRNETEIITGSNQVNSNLIKFSLLDTEDQIINNDQSPISIKSSAQVSIIGSTTQNVKEGMVIFENLIFKGKVNETFSLLLTTPAIDYEFVSKMVREERTETKLKIKFRNCIEGEQGTDSECNVCK
jgi:hypothetical protein